MNVVKRPTTKFDREREKFFPRMYDSAMLLEKGDGGNITKRIDSTREYRSYAEAVSRSDSSEEEQRNRRDQRIKENKNRGVKERSQFQESYMQRRWYKDQDNRETEIQRKHYSIAIREVQRNVMDREEDVSSPSQSNLTSLMTTTRYMTEEMRNLCMIIERRLNIAEEIFARFEDRQRRQEELLISITTEKDRRERSKEHKGRKEDTRSVNGD